MVCLYVSCDEYGQDFTLDVRASTTFSNIRAKLQRITSIPARSQGIRLVTRDLWVDTPEEDGRTLSDYDIGNNGDYIHVELVRE